MIDWIVQNRAWLFSGVGVTIIIIILPFLRKLWLHALPRISTKIVAILMRRYSYVPFEKYGIRKFYVSWKSVGEDKEWTEFIRSANNIVEILGYSLSSTLMNKEFTKQLAKLARDPKMQLRILFADPESPIVKERAYSLDINHSDLRHRMYKARNELATVIDPGSPLLGEIRTFSDVLIPYSFLRVDSRMLVEVRIWGQVLNLDISLSGNKAMAAIHKKVGPFLIAWSMGQRA